MTRQNTSLPSVRQSSQTLGLACALHGQGTSWPAHSWRSGAAVTPSPSTARCNPSSATAWGRRLAAGCVACLCALAAQAHTPQTPQAPKATKVTKATKAAPSAPKPAVALIIGAPTHNTGELPGLTDAQWRELMAQHASSLACEQEFVKNGGVILYMHAFGVKADGQRFSEYTTTAPHCHPAMAGSSSTSIPQQPAPEHSDAADPH